jgi:UDP-N-acetylglucosamine--N-acetylmuramyl-(pentapeptide) pyrophosphoryl-undecaprenol N-acetylglucosamine transferase
MRVSISGGGTAGHVYPALTVLRTAANRVADVTWIGTAGSLEEQLVQRERMPFEAVSAGPIVGVGPIELVHSALKLVRGTWQSWRLLGRIRPDCVLVTGGYVCVPVAFGAWLRRIPLAVFLPDVRPGRAVSLVAKIADRVAVTSESAVRHLPRGKTLVTGYPVRRAVRNATRAEARRRFGLADDRPVVLVFGGSQGARSLHEAVAAAATRLLGSASLLHIAGARGHEAARDARQTLPHELRAEYQLSEYLHDEDMAAALAAADLVVSRAGAAVLGEFAARGLPAVLVPLPIAGGHQRLNADVLAEAGAAVIVTDDQLDGESLADTVERILADDQRLADMARASRSLDRPDAAERVWSMLESLSGGTGAGA